MRRITLAVGAALLASALAAAAADVAVGAAPNMPGPACAPARDGTLELSWDNGTRRWSISWYSGAGAWVGNDFDISTISAYRAVAKMRFYTRDGWPNSQWDGFRVGFYSFSAVPGSMLWPTGGGGYFFKPSGLHGHVWVDINIGWTCPAMAFVAAVEQYYNYPNNDPYALDSNTVNMRHSWQYYGGTWSPLTSGSIPDHHNLMLRVVVNNETLAVAPASLGRVKALYH
jgi:hypothetical protein